MDIGSCMERNCASENYCLLSSLNSMNCGKIQLGNYRIKFKEVDITDTIIGQFSERSSSLNSMIIHYFILYINPHIFFNPHI